MNDGLSMPLVCPVLVGRDRALSDLVARLTDAPGPRTIVIAGEAGVGKSRLVAEVATRAAASGWGVFTANFFERDTDVPYSGIRRLLAQVKGPASADWARMGSLFGHQPDGPTSMEPMPAGSDVDRAQLTETVGALLSDAAAGGPAMLVFEDIHWADAGSLDAILSAARTLSGRTVMALTYRPEDSSPGLEGLLSNLNRERLASETTLQRLRLGEVEEMVRATAGARGAIRADVLHRLFTLSDGNPFLVEEFLHSMLDEFGDGALRSGQDFASFDVPRGINEAVLRRTRGLSAGARSILNLAAVAGARFDFQGLSRPPALATGREIRVSYHDASMEGQLGGTR